MDILLRDCIREHTQLPGGILGGREYVPDITVVDACTLPTISLHIAVVGRVYAFAKCPEISKIYEKLLTIHSNFVPFFKHYRNVRKISHFPPRIRLFAHCWWRIFDSLQFLSTLNPIPSMAGKPNHIPPCSPLLAHRSNVHFMIQ